MITHPSMTDDLNQRLRVMMDEAVEERSRINRRIRSLRELLSAVERGEALEPDIELAALLTSAQRPAVRLVEPPQEPLRPALIYPTGSGLVTRLGAGLPGGMLSPVAVPPPAAVVAPALMTAAAWAYGSSKTASTPRSSSRSAPPASRQGLWTASTPPCAGASTPPPSTRPPPQEPQDDHAPVND